MTILALVLDVLAYGIYAAQRQAANLYMLGTIAQAVVVVGLIICLVAFKGKRFGWFNFETWVHNFSLRYTIVVLSFILNALLLFLYVLNVTGRNGLIFN